MELRFSITAALGVRHLSNNVSGQVLFLQKAKHHLQHKLFINHVLKYILACPAHTTSKQYTRN